ncbi:MAG TPA: phosphotransferase [Candidatus Limnocylindria bacterium]|nr:phosphotransferase [Candidatus Limnocylindria bacterium]
MTPDELAAARWFRAKHRRIAGLREVEREPLGPGRLVVIEVTYADDGGADRYLVPEVDGGEPADGSGMWSAIVELIAGGAGAGAFRSQPLAELAPGPMHERRLGVEQSNTSVVIGDRLILKLYRLLEPGENPDLEIGAFLTHAGFTDTPAVLGALRHVNSSGEPATAAMLQAYVPATGDGWSAMLAALAGDPQRATVMAVAIGQTTARMHAVLASRPGDSAFPARTATVEETAMWRASAEGQLAGAIAAVSGDAHDRLVAVAPAVRARFADAFGQASGDQVVTRIHGDYHLGQLLARTDGGFSVIDFEGEPARPLAERRRPTSPLRDVAGMLRSLDYAARTAEATGPVRAERWLPQARDAFLGAYGAIGPLVEAFELEKACYEVRYEASNRPDWLWLPLAAVERLVAAA